MNINIVIEIVRQYKLDEMMTAGAGGFTGSADAAGPVAGYDPVMEPPCSDKKKKKIIGLGKGSRKRWMT
jgi:hypothetical protein